MPRRARHYLPGLPYHIVQRGNNRAACFFEDQDYQHYLDLWQQISRRYGVDVHAYCLMTNHIHFLATPQSSHALSNTMKVVASRYAQYVNKKYRRTGSLWEGRHRSNLIQTERYLLVCYRYIELNPVRAGMLDHPEDYSWSSYGFNGRGGSSWLAPHDEYLRLGKIQKERTRAYRELFRHHISDEDTQLIRKASHYSQPVGDEQFRQVIEARYGIRLGQMKRGRPTRQR